MEPRVRLGQRRKLAGTLSCVVPVEAPAVDKQTADHHAVAGQEFGRRMIDKIGAVLERTDEIRRGKRRVDQQR